MLPLVPTYIAYLSGTSADNSESNSKYRILINSIIFCAGFITVFMIFGLTATKIGNSFANSREFFRYFGGIFMIVMSFVILNKIPFLSREFKIPAKFKTFQGLTAFIAGIVFGFAWSPCVGPILSVVLLWSSRAETAMTGVTMLFLFGIGLAIPFIIIGQLFDKIWPFIRENQKYTSIVKYVSAIILFMVGILLLTGHLEILSSILVGKFSFLQI